MFFPTHSKGKAKIMSCPSYLFYSSEFFVNYIYVIKLQIIALAGVAQWIECRPANQGVAGSIPSQGPCLGWGPGPQ